MIRGELLRPAEGLLVAGSALGLVLLSADVATDGLVSQLDASLLDEVTPTSDPAGWLGRIDGVGNLGVSGALLAVVTLVAAHLTFRLWPLLLAAGNSIAMALIVFTLKYGVGREGPVPAEARPDYPGYFPSGHTATAAVCCGTAVFIVVGVWSRRWHGHASGLGLVCGLAAGAAVGLMAIVSGHHWVSDVVGSLLTACMVLPVGFALCRRYVDGADRRTHP